MSQQQSLTGLYNITQQTTWFGEGALSPIFTPGPKGNFINVVKEFPWSTSPSWTKNTAPAVILKEFLVNESTIFRQTAFYTTGGFDAITNLALNSKNNLAPYEYLFPKDRPTGFIYYLPYFSDINFSVSTPEWTALDNLEQLGGAAKEGANFIAEGAGEFGRTVSKYGKAGLALFYPKVGVLDRPRLWKEHAPRQIDIKFTLFNTLDPQDWKKNRDLCTLLINQNLYNKRDFITGIPPVFYEILVPGQHYSYAACVTNITVYNRGNMRTLGQDEMKTQGFVPTAIVPDAYEIQIQLTDMVVPSKNLFQQINKKEVYSQAVSPTDERNSFGKSVDRLKDNLQLP